MSEAAIGPYEEIFTTVKKGNYDGANMWSDQVASVKRSYKVLPGKRNRGR